MSEAGGSRPANRDAREPAPRDAEQTIRLAILDHGPITFAEFMDLALYGPGGFYERPPVGREGHFVTSPHVHPVFGELLGAGFRAMWEELGRPAPFHLVELGAGDGTLARQVRQALADVPKRYTAVERTTGARAALGRIEGLHVAASLEALGQHIECVIFANELLDNLPFAWVRGRRGGDPVEVRVGLEDGRFVAIEWPITEVGLLGLVPHLAAGKEAVIPTGALHAIERIARVLRRGYAILIDYPLRGTVDVHGYRGQRPVEDVLAAPGSADITAGVDFMAQIRRARDLGLEFVFPFPQAAALDALGYRQWAERERGRQAEAQGRRSGREAVQAWSGRHEASLLVDPNGLGGFEWLVLRTPGLEWPGWVAEASKAATTLRTDACDEPVASAEAERDRGLRGFVTYRRRRRRRKRSP